MKAAGLTVVRMGESTWSLWEPEDGHFEYAWMDHVVDAMGKAGIKVIMGTPTYSIPTWMAQRTRRSCAVGQDSARLPPMACARTWTDSPAYRFYAERMIRHWSRTTKTMLTVIGWQIDNETVQHDAANRDVFIGFQHYLKKKFGTTGGAEQGLVPELLGRERQRWEDFPTRQGATSTAYKLEWTRWSQMRVTDFLHWQAGLVREYAPPGPVRHAGLLRIIHEDVNEYGVARALDVVADNIYPGAQDHKDGDAQASRATSLARSSRRTTW